MASQLRIRHARTLAPALSSLGGRFAYGQREKRKGGRKGGTERIESNHPGGLERIESKVPPPPTKKHEKIINKKTKKWIKWLWEMWKRASIFDDDLFYFL